MGSQWGGHSSREFLDTILLAAEYLFLSVFPNCMFYQRMEDDISAIFVFGLDDVHANLGVMASNYPECMPLNIQISFGYSRFLDLSLMKLLQLESNSRIVRTFMLVRAECVRCPWLLA